MTNCSFLLFLRVPDCPKVQSNTFPTVPCCSVCVWMSSGTLYLCLVHGGGGWDVNVFKCLFHHVSLFFTFYLFYTMLLLFVLLIICFAWTCACVILYFFFFSFSLSLSLPVSFVFVWFYMNLFSTVLICLTTDVLVG